MKMTDLSKGQFFFHHELSQADRDERDYKSAMTDKKIGFEYNSMHFLEAAKHEFERLGCDKQAKSVDEKIKEIEGQK